jgi:hypothetical protein
MLDVVKPLLESGLINEDIGQQINEAWESKLIEAREQIRAELREEFAQRYEHDRTIMVEALDKMMTENLREEIEEFHREISAMNEERAKAQVKLRENMSKFNDFMVTKLAEEITELRNDRKLQLENQKKLEKFIIHSLAKEITEFAQDKKAVVEAKVKLVSEGRKEIEKLKKKFISENAKKVKSLVEKQLKFELNQLKEDIQVAKENNFGRKLFEAFASEFSVTYLNEKAETRKLLQQLEEKDRLIQEAKEKAEKAIKLAESKEREVRIIKETAERERIMAKLLAPLNEEKKEVMKTLLENVQTPRLHIAFEKYLPAVLNSVKGEGAVTKSSAKSIIVEATGDKTAKKTIVQEDVVDRDNVIEIKRLAGL